MNWRLITIILSLQVAVPWSSAGQDQAPPAPVPGGVDGLSAEELQSRLKEIEDSQELDDAAKKALGDRYREALDSLVQAARFRALEEDYRQALADGPGKTRQIREEIEALKKTGPDGGLPEGIDAQSSGEQLEEALARQEADLSERKAEFKTLEEELASLRKRTGQIGEREAAAEAELAAVARELAAAGEESGNAPDPAKQAEWTRLQALCERLKAEIAMIEQERLSDGIRQANKEASRNLAEQKVALAEKRITEVRELVSAMLSDQLGTVRATVAGIRRKVPELAPELDQFLNEVLGLISEAHKVADSIKTDGHLAAERETELSRIENTADELEQQLEFGGLKSSLAQVLLDQLRTLPDTQESNRRLATIHSRQAEANNGLFELNRSFREEARRGEAGAVGGRALPDDVKADVESLREARDVLRQDLRTSYRSWIKILAGLDRTERGILTKSERFREYAKEKLLLVRTSPVIGAQTFRSLPAGLAYCYGTDRLTEIARRLGAIPVGVHLVAGLLVAALVIGRRAFVRQLRATTQQTRRISTDRYGHTLVALAMTVLLAAPAALAAALLGLMLSFQPDASDWSLGLGAGLLSSAWFLFEIGFLLVLCRKEGLAEGHFRWDPGVLRRVRHFSWWLILACVPAGITLSLVVAEPGVNHLDGLGRMAGLGMVLGVSVVVAFLLHPAEGVAGMVHRQSPRSLFGRLRNLWFALVVVITLFFAGLLLGGYVLAGVLLMDRLISSLVSVAGAFVIYGLVLRWFSIRERRLAVEEALRARRARQEAAQRELVEGADQGGSSADETRIPELDEEDVDLARVGEQTRSLIGFIVGASLLVKLFWVWSEFGPLLRFFNDSKVLGAVSIADLAVVLLVISVVVATIRNLPGLLEVLILSRLGLDAGTRNSMVTLAKYGVIAAGAAFLFQTLGVDWSKFGWMAAALGVGLGFGLQEVVANFVCGIILLFERPVRVGDIVTVDGIDGVVSRIQIRATTITNWDRKEFVVPNKQFVTGTVLNWTLSNPMNRIVITVGVAYGSDVGKARQILMDVARDHPLVLDEPVPMASFEEFADSSLTLRLRCFLPDMDNRLITISELHGEIDKRFREAGVEIPFPQRDLHLRSAEAGIRVV